MILQLTMPEPSQYQRTNDEFHRPVLLKEVMEYLQPRPGGVYVDATLGMGGHALEILKIIGPEGMLIGLDRDEASIRQARVNLGAYFKQTHFVNSNFRKIAQVISDFNVDKVDGILIDCGISSFQLNNPQRGFSLRADGPLDMRMNQEGHISAYDLVNSLSEKELEKIIRDYGEERWSHRIARSITVHRSQSPIETTRQLRHIIMKAMPGKRSHTRIHPATRTFQAFRIAVNAEIESLKQFLDQAPLFLRKGARLAVISFHSLEDRLVKHTFREQAKSGGIEVLTKKPIRPTEVEIKDNPRARSARLRIAERK